MQRSSRWTTMFILIMTLVIVQGKEWSPGIFPNPKRDTYLCGRDGRKSSICDPDAVLSEQAANRLEGLIGDIEDGQSPYRQAPCGSRGMEGYQIAVAVMKKMKIEQGLTPQETAKEFAKVLHARWGVGQAACDNGVLLLVSVDDRQIYISTGVKASEYLPSENLNLIISWMIPYLKNKEYGEALIRAVTNVGLGLSGWELSKEDPSWGAGVVFALIVSVFIIFSMVSGLLASRKQRKRLQGCKDVLAKIKEEQAKVQSREWSQHKTCPVCFEEFEDDKKTSEDEQSPLLSDRPIQEAGTRVPRLVLQCGHSICEPCLTSWMERNTTCPVCRSNVDDVPSTKQQEPVTSHSPVQTLANDVLLADIMYRLRRVQTMYPEFVTDDLMDAWNTDAADSGTFDIQRFSDHQVRSQAIAAAQTERGDFGSSTSFGGGRGGGGGAGGSW